jgi:hypothetical protein
MPDSKFGSVFVYREVIRIMAKKEDFLFDKRIIKRNINAGKTTKEDYNRYLNKLKDVSGESEVFEAHVGNLPQDKSLESTELEES